MRKFATITLATTAILLSACSTQQTYLKNQKTGQVVYCGGGVTTDLLSYAIQKSVDKNCVETLSQQGYEQIEQSNE